MDHLFAQETKANDFLEAPALELEAKAIAQEQVESMAGREMGSYRILSLLGSGGMGEVYRAQDNSLRREVAIKVLPQQFSQDTERLARFQREARLLASLNHPNIAAIHGLDDSNGVRFLVLELVEGETLANRLAKKGLPVQEALEISQQIAEGLEAAHESGVIHRDLKPANVIVTADAKVKILDFGLAKLLETSASADDLSRSPTRTGQSTSAGVILGTAAYMSPEQARGKKVDRRSDIWAFGCVLYELLTGTKAFVGETVTDILGAIVHTDPDWEALPEDTPWAIRKLLRRCLEKDPHQRLHDIADARIEIAEVLRGSAEPGVLPIQEPGRKPSWKQPLPLVLIAAGSVLLTLMAVWILSPKQVSLPQLRYEIPLAKDAILGHNFRHGLALSSQGTRLAYVSAQDTGNSAKRTIHVHSLEQAETDALPETGLVTQPFFSPDGKWLGYWLGDYGGSDSRLKKFPLDGGLPTTICGCVRPFGASWGSDDSIVFSCASEDSVWQVPASGGEPEQLTELDREAGEISHRLPHLLPGAEAVLFTVLQHAAVGLDWSTQAQIFVQSLETGEKMLLLKGGSDARYIRTGHLVFAREGTLMAVPFDLASLSVTGRPIPVQEGVSYAIHTWSSGIETGAAQFAFSDSGSLAYIAGSVVQEMKQQLVWVDRKGNSEPVDNIEREQFMGVRISPDRSRVAVVKWYKGRNIWIYDRARGTLTPEILEGLNMMATWGPNSEDIVFTSTRGGQTNLFRRAVARRGDPVHLMPSEHMQLASSWSPTGTELAFLRSHPKVDWQVWILSMEDPPSAKPFLQTGFREGSPEFSPDGRWLAYVSNESGEDRVYVQPYPGPGDKVPISTGWGRAPAWAKGGRELFYQVDDGPKRKKMMSVEIVVKGSQLIPGNPVPLFEGAYSIKTPLRTYDVTPDGQRFLMIRFEEDGRLNLAKYFGNKVRVVQNWFEELKRVVPAD